MTTYRRKGTFEAKQFIGPKSISSDQTSRHMLPPGATWEQSYGNPKCLLPVVLMSDGYPRMLNSGDWVLRCSITGEHLVVNNARFTKDFEITSAEK